MSDNRRVYRTIHTQLRQLYPTDGLKNCHLHLPRACGIILRLMSNC